jgi:hypothetical protein
VQIDKFGKFMYVLVKLSDRIAGSKLLVRGKNGRSEQQLVSSVSKEVRRADNPHELSFVSLESARNLHRIVSLPPFEPLAGCFEHGGAGTCLPRPARAS